MARPPVKAQELADGLADRIRSGELAAGAWLPSERQLAETHGLGRSTVRQAAQILADGGLIELVAGSGARVRPLGESADEDMRGELQRVRRRLDEMEARLAAVEAHFGHPASDV